MAQKIHWTALYFPSKDRYISELEILNDKLEIQLKTDLCKDVYSQNKITEKEILIVEYLSKLRQLKEEVLTPESDIYVTPTSSPTDIKYSFGHNYYTADSDLGSLHCTNKLYYSLVSVDCTDIFEKELAEQDQLFKSFKSIISKESNSSSNGIKPLTLNLPNRKQYCSPKHTTSQKSSKKSKLLDIKLCVNTYVKNKYRVKYTDSCKIIKNENETRDLEKVLSYKSLQEGVRETTRDGRSDMSKTKAECEEGEGMDSTGLDSGLEATSSGYLTSTSPRDYTASVSEATAVATSEDIPHDSDQSARSSSMSSDAGTWDADITGNVKTVMELTNQEINTHVTHLETVSGKSQTSLQPDDSLLDKPYNHHITDQSSSLMNDNNYMSEGYLIIKKTDNGSQIATDARNEIPVPFFSVSDEVIETVSRREELQNGKNNFFINAASLLDENEVCSLHQNSLNYSQEVTEVNCYTPLTEAESNKANDFEKNKLNIGECEQIECKPINMDQTSTEQGDLEKRRSSLIRRNTFELELDDRRLAALRKECERHKIHKNNGFPNANIEMSHNVAKSHIIDKSGPQLLPGLLTVGFTQKCDDDVHSPDSLNNDGSQDNPFEKDSKKLFTNYSLPFEVNNEHISTLKEEFPQERNNYSLQDDSSLRVSGGLISIRNFNKTSKTHLIEPLPILSGGPPLRDISGTENTPSCHPMNITKTECSPIQSCGSVIEVESKTELKHKNNSFSSSWIVDMSEPIKPSPEASRCNANTFLSRTSDPDVNNDDTIKSLKSNNSSLGFFVPLDDPLDEKSSGDSGYKSLGPSSNKDGDSLNLVSREDVASSTTNLSSCSSSCGFYVDLKDTQKVTERPVDKGKCGPDKKLFSMFIDIGDSRSSEQTRNKTISPHAFRRKNNRSMSTVQSLKCDVRHRFSDSQMSSESSLELADICDISRPKQSLEKEATPVLSDSQETNSAHILSNRDDKNKKQGFYMFIETEQSPVPLRRNLPSGLLPASQRHSWNSESHQANVPLNGSVGENVPRKTHKRSHSVSATKCMDVTCNELTENKLSSVSPLVKVSASNSTGDESGPSSIDETTTKSRGVMSSWHGSVRPSQELQKVIAKNDGNDRRERRFQCKPTKGPLEHRLTDVENYVFKSMDNNDDFTSISSKGEDLSNDESSNTDKGGHSTFVISDVSNVANASSNDLEIATPTCDVVSQLSKDESDKTEIDFDDVSDNKSINIPATPDHSISLPLPPENEHSFNFVKLSDMDKEPKKLTIEEKIGVNRMCRSIPESSWIENKMMTRSATSRSLSRLFPHLNTSVRNLTPDSADHDTDFSEISSMQSSIDPSALEGSTEETDGSSCTNGPVSRLGEDLLRMFLDEISPDVTVEVGGRRIKAHKCILSSRCQYFAAILSGGWVESAGNVISLQGFSYSAVHFALCHIYSGASNIPDSINIVELATLADMLCLEGLKEVIMYTLKVKYCHFFHKPCPMCTVGVLECLPLAAAYGLDEIYRKSLRWISKNFVRVWPTKGFASLPRELLDKCYKQHIVHMTVDNVLETVVCCGKLQGLIPNVRWAEPVFSMASKLHDAAIKFIAQHFSEILSSDSFMSLGKEQMWTMSQLEEALLCSAEKLPPDQACKCHSHLHQLCSVLHSPESALVVKWNDGFVEFLNLLSSTVEACLLKQAARASRTPAWTLMEPELRHKIQDAACLVIVPGDDRRRARHLHKREANNPSKRVVDVLQSKQVVTDQATTKRTPVLTRPSGAAPVKPNTPIAANKAENSGPRPKTWPYKISEVKSRYLEPKATPKQSPAFTNKSRPEKPGTTTSLRRNVSKTIISSSDSSRTSSPATRRAVPQRASRSLTSKDPKREENTSMSTDSLTTDPCNSSGTKKKLEIGKTNQFSRGFVERNVRSLSVKPIGAKGTTFSVSLNETKVRPGVITKVENDKPKYSPIPLSKRSSCQSSPRVKETVNSTPSPSARQNVLSPKERPQVTADSKSTLLRRNITYRIQTVKPASPTISTLIKPKEPASVPPSKGNKKLQSKVNTSNKNAANNNITSNNRKSQPMVGSRSGTFLKDEPTVLKKPQVINVSE